MVSTENLSFLILGIFALLMLAGFVRDIIADSRKSQSVPPEMQSQFDLLRMQMRLEAREAEIKRYQEALAECRGLVANRLGNEGLQILESDVHIGGDATGGNKSIGRDAVTKRGRKTDTES